MQLDYQVICRHGVTVVTLVITGFFHLEVFADKWGFASSLHFYHQSLSRFILLSNYKQNWNDKAKQQTTPRP